MPLIYLTLLAIFLFKSAEHVDAHAVPMYPSPVCPWPNRDRPCGCNANSPVTPQAVWKAGETNWITWFPVNGDGLGPVYMNIASAGNYSHLLNVTSIPITNPPGNPPYAIDVYAYISFQIPADLRCLLPGGVCIVQMWTPSGRGWYGCTAVTIVPSTTVVAPNTNMNCYKYGGGVCGYQRWGSVVAIPYAHINGGTTWWENSAAGLYNQISNSNYFTNFSRPACKAVFMDFFCDLVYPYCNGTVNGVSPTFTSNVESECTTVMQACGGTALAMKTLPCSLTYAAVIYPKDILPDGTPTLTPPTPGPTKTTGASTGSGVKSSADKLGVGLLAVAVLGLLM